jgi:hypothetical protein
MLLEDLLVLPLGTRVFGEIKVATMTPGVIASTKDGAHLIRWDDGYSTIPLGKVREYDEYIAAHTELRSTRYGHRPLTELHNERAEAGVRSCTARVKRP